MRRAAAAACAVALTVTACSSSKVIAAGGSSSSTSSALGGTITVFAAASLTEAFTSLGHAFETAHPGTHVTFDFGASSALALQINQGATADVFASAAPKNMQQVITAGGATTSSDFATNVMEIAVPPANPAHIASVADLARSGVKVALCQPQVPCGSTAAQVFANARVSVHPVTLEQDVKATLTKVELGEVDAGVVYVTDVRAAGTKVRGVPIAAAVNASTAYPIAALTHTRNSALAQAFVGFVLSAAGRAVLLADGFQAP
ncbi:MAG TPA: molybdate ABC transporter substrate-binding protein [Jatrophihabitantaceae bacterium]|nr:molybdate ABC transporter substrate-binding protein [Jatrophihabitantaceae bacterium]